MLQKGLSTLFIISAALVSLAFGFVIYKRVVPSIQQNITSQRLSTRLTSQERQCIIQKLGRQGATNLLNQVRQTRTIPPDTLNTIKPCLSTSLLDYIQSVLTNKIGNASVNVTSGIALGADVQINQYGQFCNIFQQYGADYGWFTLSWQAVEPSKGKFQFGTIDNWVGQANSCGQEVAVHVLSNATWAVQPVPANLKTNPRHAPSMPAKNMQDYYDFMYNVAKHYKGKITRYSIENEAHAQANWGATPEEYITELQTAHKAIKAADPNAIVEDSGISSSVYGMLTAYDMYQSGQKTAAENFIRDYFSHRAAKGEAGNLSTDQLISQMKSGAQIPGLAWANLLYKNNQYYDRLQVHYYAPWEDLQAVTDYIHKQLSANGASKTLDFLEGGYGWDGAPGNGYDPQAHARDLVKILATAYGEGADRFVQFEFSSFTDQIGQPGLFNSDGTPRPAATSYKVTAEKLTGATGAERLNLGNNIYGYKFTKGGKGVYVVWSTADTTATLPFTGSATVTDISGNTKKVNSNTIPVTISPIFVEPS